MIFNIIIIENKVIYVNQEISFQKIWKYQGHDTLEGRGRIW